MKNTLSLDGVGNRLPVVTPDVSLATDSLDSGYPKMWVVWPTFSLYIHQLLYNDTPLINVRLRDISC